MEGGSDCRFMAWNLGNIPAVYMLRRLASVSLSFLFSASEIFDLDSLQRSSTFHALSKTSQGVARKGRSRPRVKSYEPPTVIS